jgi:hypothetical protein
MTKPTEAMKWSRPKGEDAYTATRDGHVYRVWPQTVRGRTHKLGLRWFASVDGATITSPGFLGFLLGNKPIAYRTAKDAKAACETSNVAAADKSSVGGA